MAAQTGRTNNKWIQFWLDDSGGTLTDLSQYLKSVNAVGIKYDQQDVTGASQAVKNYTVGWGDAPLTVTFQFDTALIAHLAAIPTTQNLSLDVRFGIRQSQVTGEPQFGLSMSSTSGYVLSELMCNQTDDVTASFFVYGATAPAFGTTNET